MRRREVIALFGAFAAWPISALAQPRGRSGRMARSASLISPMRRMCAPSSSAGVEGARLRRRAEPHAHSALR